MARRDVLVLCYHAVSERWPAALSVTEARLRSQLGMLAERGYRGATFREAVTDPPAARTVAVTFDDAYRSVLTRAEPVLSELGFPGTVFVPTAFAESGAPLTWPGVEHWLDTEHAGELTPMSWEELRALADAGWEIGSHTRTHPRLVECSDEALELELSGSREDLERALERPCRTLAYPYGSHDDRVVAAAGAAGYEAAATLPVRFDAWAALRWPRVGVYHADTTDRFRVKVSPAFRRIRSSRAWELLRLGTDADAGNRPT